MEAASSSAAASPLSGQLLGSGPETGTNSGFEGPEVEHPLLEQTQLERVKATLYTFVVVGETDDRPGQSDLLDLVAVKAVHAATKIVHAQLKAQQHEALKAAGLAYFHGAFVFALADQLGCASMLGKGASDERFQKLGKNVMNQMGRPSSFPGFSRAGLELLCCGAPALPTPAAVGAEAAASPSSAASARTPVLFSPCDRLHLHQCAQGYV